MKLIVGGAYQGKTEYARGQLGTADGQMLIAGGMENMEDLVARLLDDREAVACVTRFHLLVRYGMEQGLDLFELVDRMLLAHPHIVIVMDEVGCGIIPLEREERLYREQVGRVGCMLAERAACVVRIVCGIGTVLKDTE